MPIILREKNNTGETIFWTVILREAKDLRCLSCSLSWAALPAKMLRSAQHDRDWKLG